MNSPLDVAVGSDRCLPLDGLRGLACVGIVFLHAHYASFFYWFWTLVDLFFVLSGFLISRVIVRGIYDRRFSLKNFMIHRALRVWPVYYLTLLICIFMASVQIVDAKDWENGQGILSSLFFLQFTHHYFESGHGWQLGQYIPSFVHSWSLAVEEQFYILLPLLLCILRKRIFVFIALILLSIFAAVYFRYIDAMGFLLISRMDGLAVGVLLGAYWVFVEEKNYLRQMEIRPVHVMGTTFFAFLLIGFYMLTPFLNEWMPTFISDWRVALGLLGFNLFYGSLILTLSKNWLPWLSKLMSWKLVVWFGGVSYALYMFHIPVRGVVLQIEEVSYISQASVLSQIAYFVVSVLLAALSKRFIEKPVLKLKRFFPLYRDRVVYSALKGGVVA